MSAFQAIETAEFAPLPPKLCSSQNLLHSSDFCINQVGPNHDIPRQNQRVDSDPSSRKCGSFVDGSLGLGRIPARAGHRARNRGDNFKAGITRIACRIVCSQHSFFVSGLVHVKERALSP